MADTVKKLNSLPQFFDYDPIQSVTQENNEIKIRLKSGDSLVLTDAAVIEQEKDMRGCFVQELELHKAEERYEFHLLLYHYDENLMKELFYATFSFKDMRYE